MRHCQPKPVLFFTLAACLSTLPVSGQHDPEATTEKAAKSVTVERVSSEPEHPLETESMQWSPDGARLAWMRAATPPPAARNPLPQNELWTLDAAQPNATPALLLSSPEITAALRGSTAVQPRRPEEDNPANPFLLRSFAWSADHKSVLLIGKGSLAWVDVETHSAKTLLAGADDLSEVSLSPDSRQISYVRDHNLCLVDVDSGGPRTLVPAGTPDTLQGELDWPYRHDLHLTRASWWSPDSSRLAYLGIDDRPVSKYALRSSDGTSRSIAYPKPGGELPLVHVFVKRVAGGAASEIDLGDTHNSLIARLAWLPDGRHIAIQRLDRRQQHLELLLADAVTGKTRTLLSEKDAYWINLSDDWHFFHDGKRFLWSSQRPNFRHLYLYDMEGKQISQLTHGDWEVTHVDAVDEIHGRVFFTSTQKSPLERQVYQVGFDGAEPAALTQEAGTHQARFAPDGQNFIDTFSSHAIPDRSTLVRLDPSASPTLLTTPTSSATLPAMLPIEYFPLHLHQGATAQAFLLRPPAFDPSHKYPVIVYMAGGPGEQLVRNIWGGSTGLWMQLMAQKGFIIFGLDNQGTAGRGHFFEEPIHLRLGAQEMTDQRDGVEFLKRLPYVDVSRLGVCGWGYGGFLTIHSMLDRPVHFKAGFAAGAITDWHLFDAIFAEKYLDDPVAHADGWNASTSLDNTSNLKGSLMLSQGTVDEEVHLENLFTLQDRLLEKGKSADILLFPDRAHTIEDSPARLLLFSRMTDFFVKNL